MNRTKGPRTAGELKALLALYPDDTPLFVGAPRIFSNDDWDLKEMRLEVLMGANNTTVWYIAGEKLSEGEPTTALELK